MDEVMRSLERRYAITVLRLVSRYPGKSKRWICDRVSPNNITMVSERMKGLEEMGLVSFDNEPRVRNTVHVYPTPKGEEIARVHGEHFPFTDTGMDDDVGDYGPWIGSCINMWRNTDTRSLAKGFEDWCLDNGYRKLDKRRVDNKRSYSVVGRCYRWNKVECTLYDGYNGDGSGVLEIILRKNGGDYLIITGPDSKRALEIGRSGNTIPIMFEDTELMDDLYSRFGPLFDCLGIRRDRE